MKKNNVRKTVKRVSINEVKPRAIANKKMISKMNIRNRHVPAKNLTEEQQQEWNKFIKMFL